MAEYVCRILHRKSLGKDGDKYVGHSTADLDRDDDHDWLFNWSRNYFVSSLVELESQEWSVAALAVLATIAGR